jgi:hypothetical protein
LERLNSYPLHQQETGEDQENNPNNEKNDCRPISPLAKKLFQIRANSSNPTIAL